MYCDVIIQKRSIMNLLISSSRSKCKEFFPLTQISFYFMCYRGSTKCKSSKTLNYLSNIADSYDPYVIQIPVK